MDRYTDFINNPYNSETNFWLGEQYYQKGHKAAALSYFLRAAEYGEDSEDLIYEALLKVMLCLKELEGRPHSTRGAILNAIIHNPERPEAYYHLSYDHQIKEEWHESYTAAIQGLSKLNYTKETLTDIDYPGEHALLFQKAVAAWWIGRCDEARFLFQHLLKDWALEDKFIDACHSNLANIGGERFFKIPYSRDLDLHNLRYNFRNSEKIQKNYSQVLQDLFVLSMLDGKENGTYIEVGSAGPFLGNNTALLETQFNWKGFSLDIDSNEVEKFNNSRKNKCILQDATKADFNALIQKHNLGETIDYLQLDVEPAENTYKVLTSIPFDKYKFRVITYEHDHYADRSLKYRESSRKFLSSKGYVMVVGDIAPDKNSSFEDWWVHPDLVDPEILDIMKDTSEGIKRADNYLLNGFQWGILEKDQWFRKSIVNEVLAENSYERFTKVEKGDIVVDIGSCVGAFTRIVANKKPEKVYCLEPDTRFIPTLKLNTKNYPNVEIVEKGIGDVDGKKQINGLYNPGNIYIHNNLQEIDSIKFDSFVNEYKIKKIDFLKVDCEGGEYDIFNNENYDWIKANVKKIAIEVHLNTPELKDKFKDFRENILKKFNNFKVYSMDNIDIKWWIWDDKFIEYYDAIMVYIDNRFDKPQKWQTTQHPTLEFTTSIPKKGCVIDCAFCPQRTLLDVYDSDKTMSLENFKKIIDKLPKEIRITFSGFTEPWLNRNCTDMLLYAHEQGHPVSAFSTGVGMTLEDVERIKNIPFDMGPNGGFCFHLPDQELIAKHPITPRYLEVVKRFKQLENHIQGFHVMSMSEVHEDVKEYFPDANIPDFWSRAGNLLGEAIVKPELEKIKDRFKHIDHGDQKKTCGCDEELYHNVVLPNGDVSLCCMDYSLSQIIGNLYEQEYEKIIPEPKTCFSICQRCENGVDPT